MSSRPASISEYVELYSSRGWVTVPIHPKGKNPTPAKWQTRTLADVKPKDYADKGVGIILGEPSGNLVDIDLDCPEAVRAARHLLPETGAVHGRPGNPGSHGWYIVDAPVKTTRYRAKGSTLVELRSTGGQTVVPPSIHPCGDEISWVRWPPEPAHIKADVLRKAVAEVAAAALLARNHPGDGARHDFALALAGMLAHGGYPQDRAELIVEATSRAAGDADSQDRVACVVDTYQKLSNGLPTAGTPTLGKMVPPHVLSEARSILGLAERVVAAPEQWDAPIPLSSGLSPIEPWGPGILPDAVRPWVLDITERMQCPIEYPAAASLVALGSMIGRRCGIRPKRRDDWLVIPNLYGCVVGAPGLLKTPAVAEVTKPLVHLEAEARKSYEEQLKAYEGEKLVFEQRKSALKDDVKRAIKNGQDTGHLIAEMDQEPEPPARIRYIVNDATVEKLGEMLCQNPNGIMMFRDELSGWLAQLGRDGHENDRGFYLEAWNGSGSYQYDRIGRGTLFIESACLSLFGTIQPGPLLARLRGGGDAESDGMIQRFQLLVWPDPPAQWRQVDQWSDASARATIKRVFRRIRDTSLPCADDDAIPYLHFDESAQDIFDTWRGVLEQRLRSGAMSNLLQSHVAKYRSLMPALALIGHLADWASDDESGDCPGPVTARAARMSTALCQVLESHAARVYGAATDGKERMAGEILDLIRSGDIRAQFVARDIYHHRSSNTSLGDPVAVTAALSCLVDLGWARVDAVKRGGRPASVYTAHPCVTHP